MRIRKINKPIKYFFGEILGISLCPFGIYLKHPHNIKTLNHEKIHYKQQLEMLILPFYILYLIEWAFKGYHEISFEKEAYQNDHNLGYLSKRKPYSWIKYL